MKLTKSQLREIIKEEIQNQITEEEDSFSKAGEEIEKKGTEGVFTAKAKKRGMTAQEFAKKVLANTDEYDTKTVRQASFAKGAKTVADKKMKITKTQLRQIIKEEMEAMMGDVQVGDEVDVIGGVMVGAVGEIVAMGSEDGKQIVVLNLLRPAADERYKDLGPQVIIQPDFIEKRTDLFAKRMGRKAENPGRGPMKYYGVKDV